MEPTPRTEWPAPKDADRARIDSHVTVGAKPSMRACTTGVQVPSDAAVHSMPAAPPPNPQVLDTSGAQHRSHELVPLALRQRLADVILPKTTIQEGPHVVALMARLRPSKQIESAYKWPFLLGRSSARLHLQTRRGPHTASKREGGHKVRTAAFGTGRAAPRGCRRPRAPQRREATRR